MSLAPDEEFCRSCGDPIKEAAVRCPSCGVNTNKRSSGSTAAEEFCQSCGEPIKANAEICPNCGVSQRSSTTSDLDIDSEVLYYVQLAFAGLLLLAALGSIADLSDGIVASVSGAVGYGIIGLALIPQVRDSVEKRHSVSTFGWTKSVRAVNVPNTDQPCAVCFENADGGVRRTYGKEFVVAGFTLWFDADGTNHYCTPCLEAELGVDETGVDPVEASEIQ